MASATRLDHIPRINLAELPRIPLLKSQELPPEEDIALYAKEWAKRYPKLGDLAVPAVVREVQGELFPRRRWHEPHEKPINHGTVPKYDLFGVVEVTDTGSTARYFRREERVTQSETRGSRGRVRREKEMNCLFAGDAPDPDNYFKCETVTNQVAQEPLPSTFLPIYAPRRLMPLLPRLPEHLRKELSNPDCHIGEPLKGHWGTEHQVAPQYELPLVWGAGIVALGDQVRVEQAA